MDEIEKQTNDNGLANEGPQHIGHATVSKARKSGVRKTLNSRKAGLIALLLLAIIAGAVSWLVWSVNDTKNGDKAINKGEFQALFLTNGQVYFGKLSNLDKKYVSLTDIYYLQVQSSQQNLQEASTSTDSSSKVSLAKLGSELHGPEDKMSVSSDQVLFWENLKNDSKVVQAIDKYQGK